MILRVGARLLGRVNRPWVTPVEWASWWNGHLGGTGILVERASWWNGHLGGTGILPVINIWSSGQDAHSTAIHYLTDATPKAKLASHS
ncbi:hypothetical protein BJP36_38075 [Moorena producens JHB]|uniref:Uncharacterized protein n=1 Tax=Moorena producens (strain JHB) TaxID=1454205 RepID=A0A9Q9SUL4_MOOP1|nr:hypothetical protein [Moorena producens]WAN69902.1 hypothetical protein BJP36_38075 [Moorena producens JHB]